ncbi:CBO0543 family protein [Paucisalibacillus globulus]|uniref:CBO0543 family protein n=1 Tax=Paucisalibacillus globulus TaxID=351095 RepID=UPI00047D2AE9|nr:CBO0543 family protein [Paucisalibacillus globulus]
MVFALLSAFIFIVIAYMIHKNISYVEMYLTILFSTVLQLIVDIVLEFNYELYGYFDKGVDYETFIYIFMIYPPLTILFINYLPIEREIILKTMYILAWTIFSIGYEYLCIRNGTLYYENWKLWYSAIIYPFIYLLIILNFLFIRKLLLLDKDC